MGNCPKCNAKLFRDRDSDIFCLLCGYRRTEVDEIEREKELEIITLMTQGEYRSPGVKIRDTPLEVMAQL